MIKLRRHELVPEVNQQLLEVTREISRVALDRRTTFARLQWRAKKSVRRTLKNELELAAHRPAFCMYCYESRGTDVDHYEPIDRVPLRSFDWSNHVLACGYCNQQAKRERFPLSVDGEPLLLDPFMHDAWDHIRHGPSGQLHPITEAGAATIELLSLNARPQLIEARRVSWSFIVEKLDSLRRAGFALSGADIDDLKFLPIVDSFHYFVHDAAANQLHNRALPVELIGYIASGLDVLCATFPECSFRHTVSQDDGADSTAGRD